MFYNRIKEYPVEYLLLAITICLQFYRLGMGEIQPWDEALYCVRANACLKFGAWLDQTQYAVGGLYSSTHPPIGIWGIALGKIIFGDATFAPRIFIAITSVIAIIYLYKIAKQLTTKRAALLTTILFGNAQIWLWYGHHAQLDVPMHAALIVTLYYTMRSFRGNSHSIIFAGGFLGIALLTKAFQPIYILPFLFSLALIYRVENGLMKLVKIVLIAACIASPWYIMMAVRYSMFFQDWTTLLSSLISGTYREQYGSWWYYLNQLIINYPFITLLPTGMLSLILVLKNNQKISKYDQIFLASIVYLAGILLLVSLIKTNMPHFILFLTIPATVCTIFCIERVLHSKVNLVLVCSVFLTVIAIFWSGSEQLRLFVKGNITHSLVYDLQTFIILGIVLLLFIFYTVKEYDGTSRIVIILIITVVLGNIYRWRLKEEQVFTDGAQIICSTLQKEDASNILLVHSAVPHEELLPQFAYYSAGLNLQWNIKKRVHTITFDKCSINMIGETIFSYDAVILYKGWNKYFIPGITTTQTLNNVDSILLSNKYKKTITRQYLLYVR